MDQPTAEDALRALDLKWINLISVDETWSAFSLRPYKPGDERQSFDDYIRQHRHLIKTRDRRPEPDLDPRGQVYDLLEIYARLNARWFGWVHVLIKDLHLIGHSRYLYYAFGLSLPFLILQIVLHCTSFDRAI